MECATNYSHTPCPPKTLDVPEPGRQSWKPRPWSISGTWSTEDKSRQVLTGAGQAARSLGNVAGCG